LYPERIFEVTFSTFLFQLLFIRTGGYNLRFLVFSLVFLLHFIRGRGERFATDTSPVLVLKLVLHILLGQQSLGGVLITSEDGASIESSSTKG
jgi:hypothetical protein